jgi:hypothetical protein
MRGFVPCALKRTSQSSAGASARTCCSISRLSLLPPPLPEYGYPGKPASTPSVYPDAVAVCAANEDQRGGWL